MDLAKFAQLPAESNGSFLKFTANDNIKIVRFCYERAEDIKCRKKLYDPATRKVVYDTEDGKWTMNLRVAVYSDKNTFELMTWDRSARFGADNLLPVFEAAGGRICDTVYKITCQKAGTLDAAYTLFPLANSKDYAMPELVVDEDDGEGAIAQAPVQPAPTAQQPPLAQATQTTATAQAQPQPTVRKKQFWEE